MNNTTNVTNTLCIEKGIHLTITDFVFISIGILLWIILFIKLIMLIIEMIYLLKQRHNPQSILPISINPDIIHSGEIQHNIINPLTEAIAQQRGGIEILNNQSKVSFIGRMKIFHILIKYMDTIQDIEFKKIFSESVKLNKYELEIILFNNKEFIKDMDYINACNVLLLE